MRLRKTAESMPSNAISLTPMTADLNPAVGADAREVGAQRHIPELDGLRGLAILIVTLYRFGKDFPADTWFGRAIAESIEAGSRGVELFFVLSGFLITGILLETKHDSRYFVNFVARRALRIFPLYIAALVVCTVVLPRTIWSAGFQAAADQQLYLWTYTSNLRMVWENAWCFGPLDHFWSLAVEEHFYLAWPLVVLLIPARKGWRWILAGAIAAGIARVAYCALGDNELAPAVLTPFRCDALLIGAAIAVKLRSPSGLSGWRLPSLIALPLLAALCAGLEWDGRRLLSVGESMWPLMWAALLIVLLTSRTQSTIAGWFRLSILQTCGRYSYAMYVFQNPLTVLIPMPALVAWLSSSIGNEPVARLLTMIGLTLLTFMAAWISWHCLEKHCLALKRYFPYGASERAERYPKTSQAECA
ncbi:MAG: acyltransferase [Pirellulales bacterium]